MRPGWVDCPGRTVRVALGGNRQVLTVNRCHRMTPGLFLDSGRFRLMSNSGLNHLRKLRTWIIPRFDEHVGVSHTMVADYRPDPVGKVCHLDNSDNRHTGRAHLRKLRRCTPAGYSARRTSTALRQQPLLPLGRIDTHHERDFVGHVHIPIHAGIVRTWARVGLRGVIGCQVVLGVVQGGDRRS